jgi:hypothetical protein
MTLDPGLSKQVDQHVDPNVEPHVSMTMNAPIPGVEIQTFTEPLETPFLHCASMNTSLHHVIVLLGIPGFPGRRCNIRRKLKQFLPFARAAEAGVFDVCPGFKTTGPHKFQKVGSHFAQCPTKTISYIFSSSSTPKHNNTDVVNACGANVGWVGYILGKHMPTNVH